MDYVKRLKALYELRDRVTGEIAECIDRLQEELDNARSRESAEELRVTLEPKPPGRRRLVAVCGTDSGYYKHRREAKAAGRPIDACRPCKAAHCVAERERLALRSAEKLTQIGVSGPDSTPKPSPEAPERAA